MTVIGPPYGATPEGARALVMSITEGRRPAGADPVQRVNNAQLETWIDEAAAEVAVAIRGYERLDGLEANGGQPDLVDAIETRARALVQTYAAGNLAGVTYPERTGTTSYAQTLMNRYDAGLHRLTDYVDTELDRLGMTEPAAATAAEDARMGPAVSAPAPFMLDSSGRRRGF